LGDFFPNSSGHPVDIPSDMLVINSLMLGVSLPGTDVMIFKIFSPKNFANKLAFLTQNKAKLCKNLIITLVFEKNANFFAENCQKSQKIAIITLTPGLGCTGYFCIIS
jgi:hypothetical protein